MKSIYILAVLFGMFVWPSAYAQIVPDDAIDSVIVETYYIADKNDTTDTAGGRLPLGAVTYRVFLDLKPGVRLAKVYGDEHHAMSFESSASFYNHSADGVTFANEMGKARLKNGVTALDTWLTINSVTSKPYYGVLKMEDTDDPSVAKTKKMFPNDGGTAEIAEGLLQNNDMRMGLPLTKADGMIELTKPLSYSIFSLGISDIITKVDSSIFGSVVDTNKFVSKTALIQASPATVGPTATNRILIGQLTTVGKLRFSFNVELYDSTRKKGDSLNIDRSVIRLTYATDSLYEWEEGRSMLKEGFSPWLQYPPSCGCKDKNYKEYSPMYARHVQDSCKTLFCGCTDKRYLEYKAKYGCQHPDSCKTLKVFGCTDPLACNYNPKANMPLNDMCCYPGRCNNRDMAVVCPEAFSNESLFFVYPNPAQTVVKLQIYPTKDKQVSYKITNSDGVTMSENNLGAISQTVVEEVNVTQYPDGTYIVHLQVGDVTETKKFSKKQ